MEIRSCTYDHPHVSQLVERLQAEYTEIYGAPDVSPTEAGQFSPPRGAFAVGYVKRAPVAMGGWRVREDGRAELKRMYVIDEHRGRGYSRSVLAWLEESAAAAGAPTMVLETNRQHPAAIGLYRSCGYTDVPAFGYYADDPLTVYLGRPLLPREV
ncbi:MULTISPECIES: GNAT family N-acetyltransferase [unclassified Streptomyces]|uniref:GNAT family N-acetyltransferase n=1 Tax=unclassified Streptomyces TaxID=2593676 RepID=UPI0008239C64|nr:MULTISPECIES: GNAT family N-acetyltransferase [unclassified Streptomyces]MYT95874.1 GNAT family N-acetyltransferase [Streptomyces sp. SID8350]SCK62880.1 Ribosomal protein S18 acetylase RimI [Streptomyces sp. AmelKG-D3]